MNMQGVAFVNEKGGVGKTTLAHALALGASWKNIPAYFAHTDKERAPLKVNGRPYSYYDARDPKILETLTTAAVNTDGLFILDSGGSQKEFDEWIASSMDLIILPLILDEEAVNSTLQHNEILKRAGSHTKIVINNYPSRKLERQTVQKYLDIIPEEDILGFIEECKPLRILRDSDSEEEKFVTPPTKVNGVSRKLYFMVKAELERLDQVKKAA